MLQIHKEVLYRQGVTTTAKKAMPLRRPSSPALADAAVGRPARLKAFSGAGNDVANALCDCLLRRSRSARRPHPAAQGVLAADRTWASRPHPGFFPHHGIFPHQWLRLSSSRFLPTPDI